MKLFIKLGFLSIFGVYGLGLVGVLDDPKGIAELKLNETHLPLLADAEKTNTHYTLKAMR